ncbi:MAG TPA: DM13 domain-containing protein [Chloroflexia bacterium]
MYKPSRKLASTLMALTLGLTLLPSTLGYAQENSRTFAETGKTVKGRFLEYWQQNGGLAQQGYPISEPMQEKSDTNGKTYTVQYFERAAFELHPENQRPNDVLLSLLGSFLYKEKYPSGAPNQKPSNGMNSRLFAETGKRVGGVFLDYWNKNGGLAQQGYPISEEFQEKSQLDGKTYTVQYFERAVFELHPENQPPHNVLLSQLGTFRYKARTAQASNDNRAAATPTARPTSAPTPAPTAQAANDKKVGVIAHGNFDRQDDVHYASGQAIIARQQDGSVIVRLQDLAAANGPDLYVYVSTHPNPKNHDQLHQGAHNLGSLKATNGSFNYTLDPSIDPTKLGSVVIYCRAFSVIFSVATLQPAP